MSNKDKGIFEKALSGMSNVLAAILCVLITPQIHKYTVHWMSEYVAKYYGSPWVHYVDLGWFVTIALFFFFFLRLLSITFTNLGLFKSRN
ncbi:MAG: hypothetical protein COC24_002080 [Alphaproteobacteria bacterium]|nr:hypothetical protein [Alphaproteobacteria bacterium]